MHCAIERRWHVRRASPRNSGLLPARCRAGAGSGRETEFRRNCPSGKYLPSAYRCPHDAPRSRATEPNLILELPRAEHVSRVIRYSPGPAGFPAHQSGSERLPVQRWHSREISCLRNAGIRALACVFDLGSGQELRITGIAERCIACRERLHRVVRSHHPGMGVT